MIAIIADGRWGKRVVHFLRGLAPDESVTWGARSPSYAKELQMEEKGLSISSYLDAIKAHQLIVVALPYQDLLPWTDVYAPWLNGKIVIDLSSPQTSEDRLLCGWRTSVTEELQKRLPESRIVGAKSTAFQGNTRGRSVVYVTSDDEGAKRRVIELFRRASYSAVDAGGLEENRAIDRIMKIEELP